MQGCEMCVLSAQNSAIVQISRGGRYVPALGYLCALWNVYSLFKFVVLRSVKDSRCLADLMRGFRDCGPVFIRVLA